MTSKGTGRRVRGSQSPGCRDRRGQPHDRNVADRIINPAVGANVVGRVGCHAGVGAERLPLEAGETVGVTVARGAPRRPMAALQQRQCPGWGAFLFRSGLQDVLADDRVYLRVRLGLTHQGQHDAQ